jgi:glycosyltransferase involved in cell wall biosynthesis
MHRTANFKTALVHHWLVARRGGERVFEALAEIFPAADIFTLLCDRTRWAGSFGNRSIRTSFLQGLPWAARWYRYGLPLFPLATERLDVSGYRLVISSDAATMKGVRTNPGAIHICYCHSPMRYVWSGYETYRRSAGPLTRAVFPSLAKRLRRWDFDAAQRVTHFIANSHAVAERIQHYYGRESSVIYPPVDTDFFIPAPSARTGDYFLVVSQLVAYKRVDLIIEAFHRSGRRLVIIGEGEERGKLERQATSNIQFLGPQPDETVRRAMQECRALVFAGEEDFGIVMAEAQACGKPVIAFGRGGACEIVRNGQTGILYEEQSADILLEALARFEGLDFRPEEICRSASRFTRARFLKELSRFVDQVCVSNQDPHEPPSQAALMAGGRTEPSPFAEGSQLIDS